MTELPPQMVYPCPLIIVLVIVEICFGITNGQICQFLTELSARFIPVFSFLDDNLRKYHWNFTKFGMCIYILEIWFGIAIGQISSVFDRFICQPHNSGQVLSFPVFYFRLKRTESMQNGKQRIFINV